MDWIIAEFRSDTGIDLSKHADALQRIKEEAEKAKIALSSSQEYEINLPSLALTEGATSGKPGDDVVDADFEVVDDDKKKS
jgi:molecular chaperone DnaK (HSP70)